MQRLVHVADEMGEHPEGFARRERLRGAAEDALCTRA